jgi:penicillin-binding protein 2
VFEYWLAKDRQDKIVRPDRNAPLATVETITSDVVRRP